MKLVVGLGNPGTRYVGTRHNVGYWVVEKMAEEALWTLSKSTGALFSWVKINDKEVELFKPQDFMNKSGLAVKEAKKKHPKLENKDIFLVYDDLDIKLSEYKISLGKGPKDHNGLKSIYEQVGVQDFWHVRVGIDNGEFRNSGEEYVLSKWKPQEKEIINEVVDKVVKELKHVLA
jgi:peptidyl-tRNA hydrolase, PTH1 family